MQVLQVMMMMMMMMMMMALPGIISISTACQLLKLKHRIHTP
jgi:hypothetical protein